MWHFCVLSVDGADFASFLENRTHMEKVGTMVFSMSRATGTGFRSLCSLRLREQEGSNQASRSVLECDTAVNNLTYVDISSWHSIFCVYRSIPEVSNFIANETCDKIPTIQALRTFRTEAQI